MLSLHSDGGGQMLLTAQDGTTAGFGHSQMFNSNSKTKHWQQEGGRRMNLLGFILTCIVIFPLLP